MRISPNFIEFRSVSVQSRDVTFKTPHSSGGSLPCTNLVPHLQRHHLPKKRQRRHPGTCRSGDGDLSSYRHGKCCWKKHGKICGDIFGIWFHECNCMIYINMIIYTYIYDILYICVYRYIET